MPGKVPIPAGSSRSRGVVPPAALTRRGFLLHAAAALGAGGALSCSRGKARSDLVCTDDRALSEGDRTARVAVAYADRAPDPERTCDRCQHYLPAGDGCGTCKLLRGPINPQGTCNVFARAT